MLTAFLALIMLTTKGYVFLAAIATIFVYKIVDARRVREGFEPLRMWFYRLGWMGLQSGIVYWFVSINPKIPVQNAGLAGVLAAALMTGTLAAIFRKCRRIIGRDTEADRIWRETETPMTPLDPRYRRKQQFIAAVEVAVSSAPRQSRSKRTGAATPAA